MNSNSRTHNKALEKKILPKSKHWIEIRGLVDGPLNIGHYGDLEKKNYRFQIFTSRILSIKVWVDPSFLG